MRETNRILVVDDDPDVRWMVQTYLEKHGMQVQAADGGEQMRALLEDNDFDLVVLDITMPGEDGLTLARHLRANRDIGIVMLTAASEVVDRVVGLEMGADDYMTKPFEPRELLARIKSVLRRLTAARPAGPKPAKENQVRFGEHILDLESHRLFDSDDNEVSITSMEFDLLQAFAENPDKVLNRDQLLNLAHHRDWDPFDRSIDIRIARLRRKIEPDPSKPQIIKTVRGAGYIFVTESGKGKS
ncbi:MAG: response regulator [Gammaproteobacteria bacterium]